MDIVTPKLGHNLSTLHPKPQHPPSVTLTPLIADIMLAMVDADKPDPLYKFGPASFLPTMKAMKAMKDGAGTVFGPEERFALSQQRCRRCPPAAL